METHEDTMQSTTLMLSLGTLGGAVLVVCALFFTPGKYILLPYIALCLAIAVVLRVTRLGSYRDRFYVSFGSFVLSSLALYVTVAIMSGNAEMIGAVGHAWRLGLLALIGIAVNAAIAGVSQPA